MAAIHKQKRGEVRVYYNRVPKRDGREPWPVWVFLAAILFSLRVAGLALLGVSYLPFLFRRAKREQAS